MYTYTVRTYRILVFLIVLAGSSCATRPIRAVVHWFPANLFPTTVNFYVNSESDKFFADYRKCLLRNSLTDDETNTEKMNGEFRFSIMSEQKAVPVSNFRATLASHNREKEVIYESCATQLIHAFFATKVGKDNLTNTAGAEVMEIIITFPFKVKRVPLENGTYQIVAERI